MATMAERQLPSVIEQQEDRGGMNGDGDILLRFEPPRYLVLPRAPVVTHSDYDLPASSSNDSSPSWISKTPPHSTSDPDLIKQMSRKAATEMVAVIPPVSNLSMARSGSNDSRGDRSTTSTLVNAAPTDESPGSLANNDTNSTTTTTDAEITKVNDESTEGQPQLAECCIRNNNKRHRHSNNNRCPKGPVAFAPTPDNSLADIAGSPDAALINNKSSRMNGHCNGGIDVIISDEQPNEATATMAGGSDWNMKDSFSAKDHHAAVQNRYSRTRRRHFTDPVDFEGILRIIGGCGWWQIWIYFLISLQQVPHAMFNLSVMYMMFKPDHWCYVQELDINKHDDFYNWSSDQIRNAVAPLKYDETGQRYKHEECRMYNRPNYRDLSHMPYENASAFMASDQNISVTACHSWMYDKSVMEETIVTQWNLVCEHNFHRADAQLAYALGYMIGCIVSGLSSDRFGRKPTVIGFGVLASMLGMVLPYSTYFPMFLLIRFLSAVCNEAADLAAYVLCMEITGNKHRGMVGSLMQVPWAVGYTLLALIAYWVRSWRTIQIITAALHTATVLLICVLPESPRWLIVNNRVREAEAIIRKACRMNQSTLPADLELVKHAEQRKWVKRNERANILHLLKSRELITRTLIIFVVWIATALVYYGITLNLSDQSAPGGKMFSGNFFVNNAVAGAIEIPTLLACIFLLKWGRKRSQMTTLILSGLMMLGVVLAPSKPTSIRFIFMLLGKVFIQAAFNILYIFTSEMYPTVIRNSAVGTCSMVARMGAGVASYVAILSDITLPIVPMIIFGVFSLVAGGVVIFLPETRDQPLPDTLQDAVIFLKPDKYPNCSLPSGFLFGQLNKLASAGAGASSSTAAAVTATNEDDINKVTEMAKESLVTEEK